ncbi:MAG: AAA family ATPase, partial [Caulobacterales bacterium]|nr:AAA family ATPase [Caulobacterales bacterium]
KDVNGQNREPTADEIAEIAEKKRTRSILLQSAGATLTTKFRDWWKQGDYRFRFEADGNHFRIWVADDRRPTEVELENRSTGLQWFLSFYLVFLVESQGDHRRSILLLDEPGMSLHPLAQRDLSAFFENLSETNQLIYTSHSPFLVDADRLERARKIYVDADGTTKATPNLRHSEGRDEQAGAAYAVHSALNLSVAESLLVGCQPVLVEGASDQHYLTAIKALLVSGGRITPSRELVFPPSGGTKTARVVASILTGRDEVLPFILLDDDGPGRQMRANLTNSLYAESPEKVLSVKDYVGYDDSEIEDFLPFDLLADEMDRMEREPETRLADVIQDGQPFVHQVEAWANRQGVTLPPHWKVDLAVRVKQRALEKGIGSFDKDVIDCWVNLFQRFME